jgi:hypothetical protein
MIKDTVSMILTGKELIPFVEKKIIFLQKWWEKEKEDLKTQDYAWFVRDSLSIKINLSYSEKIAKEKTFLNLLRKFPDNKHELFLDDLEYYRILEINTESLPDVGR